MVLNCHLHMDFQPLIDGFLAHKQVILSYIIAFLIASPATLRYWIAVQRSTDVPAVEKPSQKCSKKKLAWRIFARLAVVGVVATLFALSPYDTATLASRFLTGLPAFACMISMSTTVRRGMPKISVFRDHRGSPVDLMERRKLTKAEKFGVLSRIFLAAAVSVTAVMKYEASTVLAATAVSFCTIRGSSMNFTTRTYYKLVASFSAICLVISAVVVALLLHFKKGEDFLEQTSGDNPGVQGILREWVNWYLPAIHAFGPGMLISACLRFDYQNYLDSLPEGAEADIAIEVVAKPVPRTHPDGRVRCALRRIVGETGIAIPTSLPPFAPVYFCVAFFLWAFAYGGMIYAEAYTSLVFRDNYEYSSCALLVAQPFMCIGIWVLALLRGEFKKFWSYKEEWNLPAKASAPATLPTTSAPVTVIAEEKTEASEKEVVLIEV